MKAKIVAISVIERAPAICFKPVLVSRLFTENCFAWCLTGIRNEKPNWHDDTLSKKEKNDIKYINTLAWARENDYSFPKIYGEKDVVYTWVTGNASPSFQDIFTDKASKGYLICFTVQTEGHVVAIKYRENAWRFMDPTCIRKGEAFGYIHGVLSENGKMPLNKEKEMDVFEYLSNMYPNMSAFGIIKFS